MDFVPHPKGLIIESAALLGRDWVMEVSGDWPSAFILDPNPENRRDVEEVFRAQSKTNNIGFFGMGPYSYYVEEMKAVPLR